MHVGGIGLETHMMLIDINGQLYNYDTLATNFRHYDVFHSFLVYSHFDINRKKIEF